MNLLAALSALVTAGLATALLVVSPKTCSCIPPRDELTYLYKFNGVPTPAALQAAAETMFVGEEIATVSPPLVSRGEACGRPSPEEVVCTYWLDEGVIRETGLRISLRAQGSTKVTLVTVVTASRWFGR